LAGPHVVDDDDARARAAAEGARQVRVDPVARVPAHQDRLGEQRFVRHALSS